MVHINIEDEDEIHKILNDKSILHLIMMKTTKNKFIFAGTVEGNPKTK